MSRRPGKNDHALIGAPAMPAVFAAFLSGKPIVFSLTCERFIEGSVRVIKKDATGARLTVRGTIVAIGNTIQAGRKKYSAVYPFGHNGRRTSGVLHAKLDQ